MRTRGQSLDAIADHLRVTKRSVSRYLALPCPEPLQAEPEVDLKDFYLDGACGSFPGLDWLSRSPRMQAECKAICAYCPVLTKCRSYGLARGRDERGIWGGMTMAERRREIRRREVGAKRVRVVAEDQGAA
ncbi:WhiB family transcriptional regulator [Mycobacterium sp. SM1]|uniref:WhiB family transcriptional regulator n=1 Tax=Mycobacterium sp. SM1 TaxID=2816243 RepID=UPI001BCE84FD|nr:WhiB family transcriptional regulator [Mycobacterium sp. SM1]MBS4730551.1 WhiB family transcriptional regulator [Mycobacterium sp. SM1]